MRSLAGLAGGVVIGVILMEALLAGCNMLIPEMDLHQALIGQIELDTAMRISVVAIWFLGGLVSGLMATAVSRQLVTGCLSGVCLMLPVLLLAELGGLPGRLTTVLIPAPLLGAGAGAWLAGCMLEIEANDMTANSDGRMC